MPQALRDTMGRHSTITLRQNRTTINHRWLLKFRCMIHNLGHMVICRLPNTIKIHGGIGEINESGFLLQGRMTRLLMLASVICIYTLFTYFYMYL